MRVALDAGPLTLSSGGLKRYTEELSMALARTFPEDAYTLLSDGPFAMPVGASPNLTAGPQPANAIERRWWLAGVLRACREARAEVFHGTNFEVPYRGSLPAVMTLHDMSPWRDPSWHDGAGRVRRRVPLLLKLRRASTVITPSEAVRREAIARFNLKPEMVIAIPHAAASIFQPGPEPIRRNPYFLFTGTIEPRKNLATLIDAWREVRKTHQVHLILVGRRRSDGPHISPEPGLELAGEASDAELASLYRGAVALVYPSLYEGFGLPVLEAMQCGCPVIVTRDPALMEAAADAALYGDTVREIAAAMQALLERPDCAADLRAKGLRRASRFSWENSARATRAVYTEAIARFR
jgi:glycosyltransferase involved in cell wall biosynthesis